MVPGHLIYHEQLSCMRQDTQWAEKKSRPSTVERQQDLLESEQGRTLPFSFHSFPSALENVLDLPRLSG